MPLDPPRSMGKFRPVAGSRSWRWLASERGLQVPFRAGEVTFGAAVVECFDGADDQLKVVYARVSCGEVGAGHSANSGCFGGAGRQNFKA